MGTQDSRHAFPFDPRMPELPAALDPSIVGPLLWERVLAPYGAADAIESCRLVRIRYRPEERCVMQYVLTSRNRADDAGSPRRHLVTGTVFAEPRRSSRRAGRLGAQYLPELRMLVSVFPADPKLPQARTLLTGDDPPMRQALLQSFGDGRWQLERCDSDVIRYREGLSLVVRFSVAARDVVTGASETRVVYAKAYPQSHNAVRAHAHLTHVSRMTPNGDTAPRIDAPLAHLDHLAAVLLPCAEGRPLGDIIESAPLDVAAAATHRSARAIAGLHACGTRGLRVYDAPEFGRSLQRPLGILGWALPNLAPLLRDIVGRVASLRTSEIAPTHRDMKPEHLLLDGNRVTLIDLDSCAAADPVLDVALMLARLEALAQEPATRATATSLAAAFEREYFRVAPASRRDRLPLLLAASLVEVAAGLFHRQERTWKTRVPALIRLAHQHASGKN